MPIQYLSEGIVLVDCSDIYIGATLDCTDLIVSIFLTAYIIIIIPTIWITLKESFKVWFGIYNDFEKGFIRLSVN